MLWDLIGRSGNNIHCENWGSLTSDFVSAISQKTSLFNNGFLLRLILVKNSIKNLRLLWLSLQ